MDGARGSCKDITTVKAASVGNGTYYPQRSWHGWKKFLQFSIAFVSSASGASNHFLFADSKVLSILKFRNEATLQDKELTGVARFP